jgi:transposase
VVGGDAIREAFHLSASYSLMNRAQKLERVKFIRAVSDKWGMKAHSLDLRERIVRACESGEETQAVIAQRFDVSYWFVVKLWRQWRETGTLHALKRGGRRPAAFDAEALKRLKRVLKDRPDATLAELREACGVACSTVTVHNTLKRLGYRRKKNAARQ